MLFTSSANKNTYEFLYNTYFDDAVTSDKEIAIDATTSYITLSGNFENICYPLSLMVEVKTGTGIGCFISMDGEPYIQVGTSLKKGFNLIEISTPDVDKTTFKGRTMSISFREMSGRAVKFGRIAVTYLETSEKEKNRN